MPRRTSEGYASQVTQEEVTMVAAELEQHQGNGHQETSQADVVKLLAAILDQVRSEALILRPPPLTAATQAAIQRYMAMSGASSPTPASESYPSHS